MKFRIVQLDKFGAIGIIVIGFSRELIGGSLRSMY